MTPKLPIGNKPNTKVKKGKLKPVIAAKKKNTRKMMGSVKKKTVTYKSKKQLPAVIESLPIKLNTEYEERLAEWEAKESDKESFINVWALKLNTVRKKVQNLNKQYQKILYKQLQDAYEVYDNVMRSEYDDDFFAELRSVLYQQGFKVQNNTSDSALIIRFVFGVDTTNKTVHDYSRALDGARYDAVEVNKFAQWLERKTITKVIEEQRAIKKEIQTPAERLSRARRVILRMIEIRETKPIIKHTTIEPNARQMIGKNFGLCVMLGYAYRKFGRGDDGMKVDINLNLLIPPSLDLEVTIIDKLARYIIHDVEKYEENLDRVEAEHWADEVWERLIASSIDEVTRNKEYWANRQQAALAEDQNEFIKQVKERKRLKKISNSI